MGASIIPWIRKTRAEQYCIYLHFLSVFEEAGCQKSVGYIYTLVVRSRIRQPTPRTVACARVAYDNALRQGRSSTSIFVGGGFAMWNFERGKPLAAIVRMKILPTQNRCF